MIVITGAGGFIGSNLYESLKNKYEIIKVDFKDDYVDPYDFLDRLNNVEFAKSIDTIFHQGACTDTMCYNTSFMMERNFDYSVKLFKYCLKHNIRLIYASSAAIYGHGPFSENNSNPINIYATSKHLFDEYVRAYLREGVNTQVVGLRYFNVYGPGEQDKGNMASVIYQFKKQSDLKNKIQLFKNSENYKRDFIHVDDVISVNLHFMENKKISGIFNCGTGTAKSFSDIANIMQQELKFKIQEIEMPEYLRDKYQKYTCADLNLLREVGKYNNNFLDLKKGIARYRGFLSGK
tara:strand:+ start:639 stop:1514 length:876 start_codon:yes stop_codon:yes gene_type:complete